MGTAQPITNNNNNNKAKEVKEMMTMMIHRARTLRDDSRNKTLEDRLRTTRPELYIRPCYSTMGRV
jgi:hypothetical protein